MNREGELALRKSWSRIISRHGSPEAKYFPEVAVTSDRLTARGQATIPKEVRDKLALKPGDHLEFQILQNGTVLLVPKRTSVTELKGLLKSKKTVTLAEIEKAIQRRSRI